MPFSGFPDSTNDRTSSSTFSSTSSKLKHNIKTNKKQKEKLLQAAVNQKMQSFVDCSKNQTSLQPEAMLSSNGPQTQNTVKLKVLDDRKCEVLELSNKPNEPHSEPVPVKNDDDNEKLNGDEKHSLNEAEDQLSKIDKSEALSKMDAFQEKQKLIEEQNRKKKEILQKAINDRKKQTDTETRKLELVHQELQKIDLMLTNDVQFLRNSIEQASMNYMDAQKRFNKAEHEYIESKLNLHNCHEKKEMLTEHLCAIIEQNELRKSKKLNSLMDELNLN